MTKHCQDHDGVMREEECFSLVITCTASDFCTHGIIQSLSSEKLVTTLSLWMDVFFIKVSNEAFLAYNSIIQSSCLT